MSVMNNVDGGTPISRPSLCALVRRHWLWRTAKAVVHAGIIAYGILFMLYLLARVIVGERWNLVAFANNLLPWLCWTSMALAIVGLLYRDRGLLVSLQLPALVVFGIAYGEQFLPNVPPPQRDVPTLTVAFYNVCG